MNPNWLRARRGLSAEDAAALKALLAKSGLKVAPIVVGDSDVEAEEIDPFVAYRAKFSDEAGNAGRARTFGALYKRAFVPGTAKMVINLSIESTTKGVAPKSVRD